MRPNLLWIYALKYSVLGKCAQNVFPPYVQLINYILTMRFFKQQYRYDLLH